MRFIFDIGDEVYIKDYFDSPYCVQDIRNLVGKPVTIREVVNNGKFYRIKETEGLDCDELWALNDFVN